VNVGVNENADALQNNDVVQELVCKNAERHNVGKQALV
jgi:hypothetical protein